MESLSEILITSYIYRKKLLERLELDYNGTPESRKNITKLN